MKILPEVDGVVPVVFHVGLCRDSSRRLARQRIVVLVPANSNFLNGLAALSGEDLLLMPFIIRNAAYQINNGSIPVLDGGVGEVNRVVLINSRRGQVVRYNKGRGTSVIEDAGQFQSATVEMANTNPHAVDELTTAFRQQFSYFS